MRQEAGWAPEIVCTTRKGEKTWAYRDPKSEPLAVQPVVRRYTDFMEWGLFKHGTNLVFFYFMHLNIIEIDNLSNLLFKSRFKFNIEV